ncbi:TatD family hydrolase [Micrococcus sp.]|uniref:TatD family hydrolase n=1 Tax=Micrococcus sp. TaxID=1271 RepID=UPI002A90F523|nr:TatD family hydrolase [Micrococcus sp.]MDY6055332.1 TatD family hydrolase [Micrococcus sp.]
MRTDAADAGLAPAAYRTPAEPAMDDGGPRRDAREEGSGRTRRLEYPPAPEPLPVPVVDNHTHLDMRDGLVAVDVHRAMDAAEAVGVVGAVQVGCDLPSARFTVEAIETEPRLLGAVALHPNEAARLSECGRFEEAFEEIARLAEHPRVRAVGETGLDHFRTRDEAGHAAQEASFRRHIRLARRLGKALQIHDRDAHDDVVRVLLEEEADDGLPPHVVFHCFSGGPELARICAEHGWLASFAGPVTFKANDALREALRLLPNDLLLVETDAPFLTPHPHRGRPNAPYLVPLTLRAMAETRGQGLDDLGRCVGESTRRVYGEF